MLRETIETYTNTLSTKGTSRSAYVDHTFFHPYVHYSVSFRSEQTIFFVNFSFISAFNTNCFDGRSTATRVGITLFFSKTKVIWVCKRSSLIHRICFSLRAIYVYYKIIHVFSRRFLSKYHTLSVVVEMLTINLIAVVSNLLFRTVVLTPQTQKVIGISKLDSYDHCRRYEENVWKTDVYFTTLTTCKRN